MEVGSHRENKKEWKLGDKTIENCKTYKYLGEIISRDGKNTENLLARQGKVTGTVRAINTCGKGRIMKKIEVQALMTLHDVIAIATLLFTS